MNARSANEDHVFAEALQRTSPPEREAYLSRACADDEKLRERVEFLLRAHEKAGKFLDEPIFPETLWLRSDAVIVAQKPGDRIGRYKLLEQIGEGGCGVVYVAEQEEPVRRRVALKVIKLGMDTRGVIARFEAERQALALMDHPHIAKVLDAGATENGRPFFVMELVRGIKITEYCDQANLPTRERLKLFIQVCSAIQHAHQKGIIHRDIKPSNILVTLHDGVPVPKVIDFGIAKATTDQRLTDKTVYTALEQFIGTPAYMSPEQAEMSGLDIDTRSDIYALGVLLYELLVGKPPFDPASLLKAGVDQMRRIIREQEPARPSTRLSTLGDADLTNIAIHRNAQPPKLISSIRGDLDWIVMKCLEKDRTRRFETVNALATDIHRHLNHEPVVARPPSFAYRVQKFVQKNKLLVSASAAVGLALLIGFSVSTWLFVREKQAHERARRAELAQRRLHELAETERGRAETEKRSAEEQARIALNTVERLKLQKAEGLFNADKSSLALAWLAQVLRQNPSNRIAAERIISALSHRDFLVPRFSLPGSNAVAEFSPDGKRLAHIDARGQLGIYDAHSGRVLVPAVPCADLVEGIEFSRDGAQLLTQSSNRVVIWNATNLTREQESAAGLPRIHSAHFTSSGPRLICVSEANVTITSMDGKVTVGPMKQEEFGLARLSPDGKRLLTCSYNSEARLWDAATGKPLSKPFSAGGSGPSVAFSADGKQFVIGSFGSSAGFLSHNTRDPLRPLLLHQPAHIRCVDFSPDGRIVATGGGDVVTRLWDTETGKLISDSLQADGPVADIKFTPDSRRIIVACYDGSVRVWNTATGRPVSEAIYTSSGVERLKASPDGSSVLWFKWNAVQSWDVRPGRQLPEPASGPEDEERISPDGSLELKLGGSYNRGPTYAQLVDRRTGSPLTQKIGFEANIWCSEFSPDSQRLLLGIGFINRQGRGRAEVFDRRGQRLFELPVNGWAVLSAAFSRDGQLIATGSKHDEARVWNGITGKPVTPPLIHGDEVEHVVLNPDATLLVSVGGAKAVVWNATTGVKLFELRHNGQVHHAEFSSDGDLIVTAGEDRTARIWNAQTGTLLNDLRHDAAVRCAVFSPDGIRLATGSKDGTARLWDSNTGQVLSEPLRCFGRSGHQGVSSAHFVENGTRLRVSCGAEELVWDVPQVAGAAPAWLADLAEAAGGQKLGQNSEVAPVSSREIFSLKQWLEANTNGAAAVQSWGRWFFGDRLERTVSAFSQMPVRSCLHQWAGHRSVSSFDFDSAEQLAATATTLSEEIVKARERAREVEQAKEIEKKAGSLLERGDTEEAEMQLKQSLALYRASVGHDSLPVLEILDQLAWLPATNSDKLAQRERYYRESISGRSRIFGADSAEVAERLGYLAGNLQAQQKWAEAEAALRDELAIRQGVVDSTGGWPDVNWREELIPEFLAVLRQRGKLKERDAFLDQVLSNASDEILNHAAWTLASASEARLRDGAAAVRLAEKSVELVARKDASFLDTLATAFAETGEFEKAVQTEREALMLTQRATEKAELTARLKLFEAKQPYRE